MIFPPPSTVLRNAAAALLLLANPPSIALIDAVVAFVALTIPAFADCPVAPNSRIFVFATSTS